MNLSYDGFIGAVATKLNRPVDALDLASFMWHFQVPQKGTPSVLRLQDEYEYMVEAIRKGKKREIFLFMKFPEDAVSGSLL